MTRQCLCGLTSGSAPQHGCLVKAVSTADPSPKNTADITSSECPASVCVHSQATVLHNLAVLSKEAENTADPSPEKSADITARECLAHVYVHSPVAVLQSLAVLSNEAVSSADPSPEYSV